MDADTSQQQGRAEQNRAGRMDGIKSGIEARQGVISGRVLTVLVISLVLAAVALLVCYALGL